MLEKFNNPEIHLPQESPRFIAMDAWAKANELYRSNIGTVQTLIYSVSKDVAEQRKDNPDIELSVELELALQRELPELIQELHRMQGAVDKMTGWHIKWRQLTRGEAVGIDEHIQDDTLHMHVVRAPNEYHEMEGWITGNRIGVDSIMNGVSAWLEVSSEKEASKGVNYNFGEMFAVELSPVE